MCVIVCDFVVKCVVQVGEEEQGATQPEKDPLCYQEEQTGGFWLSDWQPPIDSIVKLYVPAFV